MEFEMLKDKITGTENIGKESISILIKNFITICLFLRLALISLKIICTSQNPYPQKSNKTGKNAKKKRKKRNEKTRCICVSYFFNSNDTLTLVMIFFISTRDMRRPLMVIQFDRLRFFFFKNCSC